VKLLNFLVPDEANPQFGVVINRTVLSFTALQRRFECNFPELDDIDAYLEAFPRSENIARDLVEKAHNKDWDLVPEERLPLAKVKILPPVPRPPALIDFAHAPQHMLNSGLTLVKHEKSWPVSAVIGAIIRRDYSKNRHSADFKCYKGNHNAIIGDGDTTSWPSFTSYLDVEAELWVVVGQSSKMSEEGRF